jgi:hypothetical protein
MGVIEQHIGSHAGFVLDRYAPKMAMEMKPDMAIAARVRMVGISA